MYSEYDNYLFIDSRRLINEMYNLIDKLEKVSHQNIDIPNVGITFNNKLVEIKQLYKRNNVKFNESELVLLINEYFIIKIRECIGIIMDYIKIINSIDQYAINLKKNKLLFKKNYRKEILDLFNKSNELLVIYKQKDNEMFNFKINDIPKITEEYPNLLDIVLEKAGPNTDKDSIIDNINLDIKNLGYNERINNKETTTDNKHKNRINISFNVASISEQKLEEIKKKYGKYLNILEALETQIYDYIGDATVAYNIGDYEYYLQRIDDIKKIDINNNLVETLGKYLITIKTYDKEGSITHLELLKEELDELNLSYLFDTIKKEFDSNKYNYYIEQSINTNNKESIVY